MVSGDGRELRLADQLFLAHGSIAGAVSHSERFDIKYAKVLLIADNGHVVTAPLDREGRFTVVNLPIDDYTLGVWTDFDKVEYRDLDLLARKRYRNTRIYLSGDTVASQVEVDAEDVKE
jgi:hypothetical protein